MAGEAISPGNSTKNKKEINIEDSKVVLESYPEKGKTFLPDNPKSLLSWTNSIELALSRKLLTLSHSINIELLRSGILNTLLPLNLLEAATKGHIETIDSIPNLLKIRVPIQGSLIDDGMDISCILLRPSEFEFDQPALRRNRSLLRNNRLILLKMVKQYRHWQECVNYCYFWIIRLQTTSSWSTSLC